MSQLHDGHRTFLPFGNPFRMIFAKGSYLSPALVALLTSFEKTLAESLKRLKPEDISDVFSLSWLRDAMTFLSETHININSLITDLEFPVSDWEEKWVDSYLDSSVKLLDACIALNSEFSRLDHGQLLLQYALHVLHSHNNCPSSEQINRANSTLCDWTHQINSKNSKLEDCNAILQRLVESVYSVKVKNSTKGKVLMRALHGVKAVTIFVCSVFISVLSGCTKPVTLVVPNKFLWVEAFNDLQADVSKEIMSRISGEKAGTLKELDTVQRCMEKLCASINSKICETGITYSEDSNGHEEEEWWKKLVSELGESVERLSLGLDPLSKQVGEFFQIVLTGRDALLCNLRASDDVIMRKTNEVDERM